jgi:hypothetical protein
VWRLPLVFRPKRRSSLSLGTASHSSADYIPVASRITIQAAFAICGDPYRFEVARLQKPRLDPWQYKKQSALDLFQPRVKAEWLWRSELQPLELRMVYVDHIVVLGIDYARRNSEHQRFACFDPTLSLFTRDGYR